MPTVKNAAMNLGARVSLPGADVISFECVPRRGVAGSYGSIFSFPLKNVRQVVFLFFFLSSKSG